MTPLKNCIAIGLDNMYSRTVRANVCNPYEPGPLTEHIRLKASVFNNSTFGVYISRSILGSVLVIANNYLQILSPLGKEEHRKAHQRGSARSRTQETQPKQEKLHG